MISGTRTANAVGGKTARACDSCLRKRARWYCAADDAFLCQSCDGSVHSANQLAGRHERVLLETASTRLLGWGASQSEPTWHQGFTRRARTPRARTKTKSSLKSGGKHDAVNSFVSLVPEISTFDDDDNQEKEELLYRVPVFYPFAAELCDASNEMNRNEGFFVENKQEETCNLDDLQGFDLPSEDLELMEFAMDVESLLGKGFDDDTPCGIESLGLNSNCKEEDDDTNNMGIFSFEENRVKVEDKEVEAIIGCDLDATRETLDWDFGYESTMIIREEEEGEGEGEGEEKKVVVSVGEEQMRMMVLSNGCKEEEMVRKSSILLRLNYEDVINTWADQGSPWTTGIRPEIGSDDCWPDFMGVHWRGNTRSYGGTGGSDGGREARVSRYREKRRTRLFSKKIRYEVRKRNAEKRPRMKGRFVKRETFGDPPATSSMSPYLIKN